MFKGMEFQVGLPWLDFGGCFVYCVEFQFGKIEIFLKWMVVMAAQTGEYT